MARAGVTILALALAAALLGHILLGAPPVCPDLILNDETRRCPERALRADLLPFGVAAVLSVGVMWLLGLRWWGSLVYSGLLAVVVPSAGIPGVAVASFIAAALALPAGAGRTPRWVGATIGLTLALAWSVVVFGRATT